MNGFRHSGERFYEDENAFGALYLHPSGLEVSIVCFFALGELNIAVGEPNITSE
jgi:hypothetical protein